MIKPQPGILTIWRLLLVFAAIPPSFLFSLFLRVGGLWWWACAALWTVAFLFFYLFYLPARFRKLSFTLEKDRLTVTSGVFQTNTRVMPLANVQYVGLVISPFDAVWGLCTLLVTAPGGRLHLPGLRQQDARNLVELMPRYNQSA